MTPEPSGILAWPGGGRIRAAAAALRADGLPWFWLAVLLGSAPLGSFEFVLPLYGQVLGGSSTVIGVLFSVFSLTAIGVRLVLYWGLDRWEPRRVLCCGLLLYVAAMVLFVLANSVWMLGAARLVQGAASTATWLTATVLLARQSRSGQRGAAFGTLQVVGTWGAALGAAWTFGVIGLLDAQARADADVAIAVLGLALPWPWPPLAELTVLRVIFAGYVLAALLALLAALRLPATTGSLPQAAPTPEVLVPAQRPLGLLTVGVLRGAATALTLPVLILYLNDRFGSGLAGIVLAGAVPGVVYAVAPRPLGRLADYLGYRRAVLWATVASVVTYGLLPLLPSLWLVALLWAVEALSFSMATPALSALVAQGGGARLGGAFARYSLAVALGAALAPTIGGWLYEHIAPWVPFAASAALLALSLLPLIEFRHDQR